MPPHGLALAAAALCCALTRARGWPGAPLPPDADDGGAEAAVAALPVLDQQLNALEARVRRMRSRQRRQPPIPLGGGAAAAPAARGCCSGSLLPQDDARQPLGPATSWQPPPLGGRAAAAPSGPASLLQDDGGAQPRPAELQASGGSGAHVAAARGGGRVGPAAPLGPAGHSASREPGWAPAGQDLPQPPLQPLAFPSKAPAPSVAEEHEALLALAEAIRGDNKRLRGESVELVREQSELLRYPVVHWSVSVLDWSCFALLATMLLAPCFYCTCLCIRSEGIGGIASWCSSCGHFCANRSQGFWFLTLWFLLTFVLAIRVLLQLGLARDMRKIALEVYLGYLIIGLVIIMFTELGITLRHKFERLWKWFSNKLGKFKESLRDTISAMDTEARFVMKSLSPDAIERRLEEAENFVIVRSPKVKVCC